jgi:hypothetical protein
LTYVRHMAPAVGVNWPCLFERDSTVIRFHLAVMPFRQVQAAGVWVLFVPSVGFVCA